LKRFLVRRKDSFWRQHTVTQGAVIISIFTVLSSILGLFRDRLLASNFLISKIGAAHQSLDVYYAAFFLPDTVYYLIFLGAFAAAFVPVFSSYIAKGKRKEAFDLANSFLNIALILVFCFILISLLVAPYLIKIIAPGFNLEKQRVAVSLTRLMLLSSVFFGISNTAGGMLNAYKQFTLFAIAPCLYNLGIITGIILLHQRWGIYAPTIGVLLGSFLHMLVQIYGAWRLGYKWRPKVDFRNPAVRKIFKLMVPRVAALAVDRINRWIYLAIASTLAIGGISIINLSNNLQSFPVSFLGIAVATAVFPFLAEAASLNKKTEFISNLESGLRFITYLMVPVAILMVLLRVQIVRIILGTGHFGWVDTRLTAACLGLFALSLPAQGVVPLLTRSFYALSDTLQPFKLALWTILFNLTGSLLFTRPSIIQPIVGIIKVKNSFDARIIGLAIIFSLSSVFYMLLLYFGLKKKIGCFVVQPKVFIWKIMLSSAVMIIAVQAGKWSLGNLLSLNRFVNIVTQLVVSSLFGGAVYFWLTHLFRIKEAEGIAQKIKNLFTKINVSSTNS